MRDSLAMAAVTAACVALVALGGEAGQPSQADGAIILEARESDQALTDAHRAFAGAVDDMRDRTQAAFRRAYQSGGPDEYETTRRHYAATGDWVQNFSRLPFWFEWGEDARRARNLGRDLQQAAENDRVEAEARYRTPAVSEAAAGVACDLLERLDAIERRAAVLVDDMVPGSDDVAATVGRLGDVLADRAVMLGHPCEG